MYCQSVAAQQLGSYRVPVPPREMQVPQPRLLLAGMPAERLHVRLAPPSTAELESLRRDRGGAAGKRPQATKVGFGRTVPDAGDLAKSLTWVSLPGDGLAAQFAVSSPGAKGLRLGLAVRKLPAGAEMRFAGDAAAGVLGPVPAERLLQAPVVWSPVSLGDTTTVEIYLPPGGRPADADFSLAEVAHLVVSPLAGVAELRELAGSGSCQVDAVCYYGSAPLHDAADAVARMVFTENGFTYLCSGTLLNSRTPAIPYFFTAEHCIGSQPAAATLSTFWFYESATCDSPQTSNKVRQLYNGAALLFADVLADASLLRLHDTPPAGAVLSGWNAAALPVGTPAVGLHHPLGDLKKISQGAKTGVGTWDGVGSFHVVQWSLGTSEPGSSGSGLFVFSSAAGEYELRGGLKGGTASCDNPAGENYFSRFDQLYPALARYLDRYAVDVRTYVPAAAGGFASYLRLINTGTVTTAVSVALIDPQTGAVGALKQLMPALAGGAAVTLTARQVETALGESLPAEERPRLRLVADAPIAVQSFLLQPGGVFNEVSAGLGGAPAIMVRTFVPAAMASRGYASYLRVINIGGTATAVSVARVDPDTGAVGAEGTLIASLAPGAAQTFSAAQVEAALGTALAADDRPRILVSGPGSLLEVQSFLLQPDGTFANVSSGQAGTTVDVRSYVPAAAGGYASYVRVINGGDAATPVTVALIDAATGTVGPARLLAASLPGGAARTFSSAEIEAALGQPVPAHSRPRLRIQGGNNDLRVQSFLLQPGGAFNEVSEAASGTSVEVRTYVPASEADSGYASFLRVINVGAQATPVSVALIDPQTGIAGPVRTLIASLPAGAARTLAAPEIEAVFDAPVAAGSRPRLRVAAGTMLEVQSYLLQPGGVFAEVSSGQAAGE